MMYFICLSTGACIGIVVAALCNAAHNADRDIELRERRREEIHDNTVGVYGGGNNWRAERPACHRVNSLALASFSQSPGLFHPLTTKTPARSRRFVITFSA